MRNTAVLISGLALGALSLAHADVIWRKGSARTGEAAFLAAADQARQENKPLVVYTFDNDDAPFKETLAAFNAPALGALADKCVFVQLDSESTFWLNCLKEAFDNAPWVYVMDPRVEKPWAEPLAKAKGEHRKGGGITAERLKETLTTGLAKYKDAKREGKMPKIQLEVPPSGQPGGEPSKGGEDGEDGEGGEGGEKD